MSALIIRSDTEGFIHFCILPDPSAPRWSDVPPQSYRTYPYRIAVVSFCLSCFFRILLSDSFLWSEHLEEKVSIAMPSQLV